MALLGKIGYLGIDKIALIRIIKTRQLRIVRSGKQGGDSCGIAH